MGLCLYIFLCQNNEKLCFVSGWPSSLPSLRPFGQLETWCQQPSWPLNHLMTVGHIFTFIPFRKIVKDRNNGMLRPSLRGAVIFISLQHFIAPVLDLISCLQAWGMRDCNKGIKFKKGVWRIFFCQPKASSGRSYIAMKVALFNKMDSWREAWKLTSSAWKWYYAFSREIINFSNGNLINLTFFGEKYLLINCGP